MAFDESQVSRDGGGKFAEKTGTAAEVSLSSRRKTTLPNYSYTHPRLADGVVEVGVAEELTGRVRRTPVYFNGDAAGYVYAFPVTPSKSVGRGGRLRQDLKERTMYVHALDDEAPNLYGTRASRSEKRGSAIHDSLNQALHDGIL
jgi:hypothetical protein